MNILFFNNTIQILGDLTVARNKTAQAEETSDLASENEKCSRKIKKTSKYMFDSDLDSNVNLSKTSTNKKKSDISSESDEDSKDDEIVDIPILKNIIKSRYII